MKPAMLISMASALGAGPIPYQLFKMPRLAVNDLRSPSTNQRKVRKARRQRWAAGDRRAFK
jgi:hypothetical protein